MEDTKKKYICKLPTNGHQPGDEVFMTEAEAENANGGEAEPRYVLAEDQGAETATDVTTTQQGDAAAGNADVTGTQE